MLHSTDRCYLATETTKRLVQALVISRLDYCNVPCLGISEELLSKLQKVQNQAASIISRTPYRESIAPILKSLHWLPVKARIEYAILLTVYKAKKWLSTRRPRSPTETTNKYPQHDSKVKKAGFAGSSKTQSQDWWTSCVLCLCSSSLK